MTDLGVRPLAPPADLTPTQYLEWLKRRKRLAVLQHQARMQQWEMRPDAWFCDREVCDGKPHDRWGAKHCRKIPGRSQAPPAGKWQCRYISGGRGSGKSMAATQHFAELILTSDPGEWACVAPTFADARDVVMAGPSGLIRALGGKAGPGGVLVEQGPWIAPRGWNVSTGQLRLLGGALIYCDGADDGALRIQGKNLRGVLADEIGLWKNWKTAWDESIEYAVRLSPAKKIACGTPKQDRAARVLVKRLLDDPKVPIDRLRTEDNADNLDPDQFEAWMLNAGTRLGRQELEGELLEDREGALVTWDDIVPQRVYEQDLPAMRRVLVSVDPSFSNTEDSDECGIVAGGAGVDGHGYILADWSGRYSLDVWAKRAVLLAYLLGANGIVYESNLVGTVVKTNLEAAVSDFLTRDEAWTTEDFADLGFGDGRPADWTPPPLIARRVRLPKMGRLAVVAPLWQQKRIHHTIMVDGEGADVFMTALEQQLCSWSEDDDYSPDRLDACSALVAELAIQKPRRRHKPTGELQRETRVASTLDQARVR